MTDKEEIIRLVRKVADKDKVDPVHNDMVTLTIDELGKLLESYAYIKGYRQGFENAKTIYELKEEST
jgi:hypothetical protein